MHIPVGFVCVFMAYVSWVLALVFGLAFVSYEILEEWRLKDKGWHDLKGFLWGMGIGALILWIIQI